MRAMYSRCDDDDVSSSSFLIDGCCECSPEVRPVEFAHPACGCAPMMMIHTTQSKCAVARATEASRVAPFSTSVSP